MPPARFEADPEDQSHGRATSLLRTLIQPQTTPGWLRFWGLILVAALGLFAVTGTLAALSARSSANTIEQSTAPSLIGVQDLFSSVAEANSAATGAFLSATNGSEDRAQRNLYLDAIGRATTQAQQVSSLVGDSEEAHVALQAVSRNLVVYSGEVEAARVANLAELPGANRQLLDAVDLAGTDVAASLGAVTAEARSQLDDRTNAGFVMAIVGYGAGALALGLLIWFQTGLAKRTNRVLNLPLVGATILTAVALFALVGGLASRSNALDNARVGGYDSIESTARIQTAAFDAQSALSLELIGGTQGETRSQLDQVAAGINDALSAADSPRESAAVTLLSQRFTRYEAEVGQIINLADQGQTDEAIRRFQTEGVSTFNGVNTGIESVLSDNRTQFANGVSAAADSVQNLPVYLVVLPILAALAALFGIQRRLAEYL